jgi:3-oxoacyl-[acyl-carrier protein] reductase
VIIVTGASGGLGLPLCESLADVDDVAALYHRATPDRPVRGSIQWHQVNVADPESVQRFADAIAPTARRLTLINLAGIAHSKLAVQTTADEWDDVVDVSLKGSFLMSRACLRPMIRDRWGRIINVSSVVAHEGVVGTTAYAAAKAGLHGLTRSLAKEYARYGVLVNTLVLGYFEQGMTQALSDEQRREVMARIPLRRLGQCTEIAEAVKYLMRSNYVTGTTLTIDGGLP